LFAEDLVLRQRRTRLWRGILHPPLSVEM